MVQPRWIASGPAQGRHHLRRAGGDRARRRAGARRPRRGRLQRHVGRVAAARRARLPDTAGSPVDEVAANAELLILAVPDAELAGLVAGLAATGAVKPGTIVAHTSGANGIAHPRRRWPTSAACRWRSIPP